jgi:MFS family permease
MKRLFTRVQGQPVPESDSGRETETSAIISSRQRGSSLLRGFSSLRHRNYRLYWFGQLISSMGTGMQNIGQAWLVLELTHSAFLLGVVGAVQYLPVLLFSLFGGVFADRWPKRSVLLVTQTASMIQAVLLWALIVTGTVQLWQIYVLAALLGLTSSLDQPTRSAFVVEMVGREDLPNAVALSSSLMNLARIVGPAIGGVIIALSGVESLFLLNGISFLAVIVALALMKSREFYAQARIQLKEGERQSTWRSLSEGVCYVWKTPSILLVIVVVGMVLLFGANYNVVLPLFATNVLHTGAKGYGFLSAAIGIGSLIAVLWLAWSNWQPTIRRVLFCTLVFSLVEIIFALSHSYLLSLGLIAAVGAVEAIYGALAITIVQMVAPDHLRGRVNSVLIFFFTGSVPPGYLLAGWLSGAYGVSIGLVICMLLSLLTVGIGWIFWKPAEQDLETSTSLLSN